MFIQSSCEFVRCYQKEDEECVGSIETVDEILVHYFMPETKEQSQQWRHSSTPNIKKLNQKPLVEKVIASVLYNKGRSKVLRHANKATLDYTQRRISSPNLGGKSLTIVHTALIWPPVLPFVPQLGATLVITNDDDF